MRNLLSFRASMPLAVVVLLNAYRWLEGRGFEPTLDNVVSYVVLIIVLLPAALAVGVIYRFTGARAPTVPHALLYVGTAAFGSGTLLAAVDYADGYFTPSGVGLAWPLTGIILGSAYGLLFSLTLWISRRRLRSS